MKKKEKCVTMFAMLTLSLGSAAWGGCDGTEGVVEDADTVEPDTVELDAPRDDVQESGDSPAEEPAADTLADLPEVAEIEDEAPCSWTSVVQSAPHLVSPTSGGMGLTGQGIAENGTNDYVIDPKGDGIPWGAPNLIFQVRDNTQSLCWTLTLYKLDPNNCEVASYMAPGDCADLSGYARDALPLADYDAGYKFILELKENGQLYGDPLSCGSCVTIFWLYR